MWNYRVIKHESLDETVYGLHEVYYDKKGKPNGYTENAVAVGDTVEELKEVLKMMLSDITKNPEVLTKEELEK